MGRGALALLLCGAVAASASAEKTAARCLLTLHRGLLDVVQEYPAGGLETAEFEVQASNRAGEPFQKNWEAVEARTLAGEALTIDHPKPRTWLVHARGRAFQLRYRVRCLKSAFDRGGSVFDPTLLKDWVLLIGSTWYLEPQDGVLARLPILARVAASDYPHPTSSWDQGKPLESQEALCDSLLVAGDYSFQRFTIDGRPVTLALEKSPWRFSPKAMAEAIRDILSSQTRWMGFYPVPRLLIAYVPDAEYGSSGGTALQNAFFLYHHPDKDPLDARDDWFLSLIAHEHFHLWNGKYARGGGPDGRTKWLSEGFTRYYGRLTLFRTGRLSAYAFQSQINQWLKDYLENPAALTGTIPLIEKNLYAGDRRYENLAGNKGAVLAFLFDLEIRRLSKGKRSLDDLMREIMRRYPPGKPYDNDGIRRLLEKTTSSSWKDFFRRYVAGAEEIPIEAVCRRSALAVERVPLEEFQLGFETEGGQFKPGVKVLSVLPGSNAAKAGLRAGEILRGVDITWNLPERRDRVWVRRSGSKVEIAFYPAKPLGRSLPLLADFGRNRSRLAMLANP